MHLPSSLNAVVKKNDSAIHIATREIFDKNANNFITYKADKWITFIIVYKRIM